MQHLAHSLFIDARTHVFGTNMHGAIACVCVCPLRCIELLKRYYQGQITHLDEDEMSEGDNDDPHNKSDRQGKGAANGTHTGKDGAAAANGTHNNTLLSEKVTPRTGLPPLLTALADRKPERLHYMGGCVHTHTHTHTRSNR